MTQQWGSAILGRRFRLSSLFRIVPADQLSQDQLEGLGGLCTDGEVQAVLMPTVPLLSAKAVCGKTLALLRSLRLQALPPTDSADATHTDETLLARLVLDSVLEIEHEGQFLSGPSARTALNISAVNGLKDIRPPVRLSLEALRYGEALEVSDPLILSGKLYAYNRVPMSPWLVRRAGTQNQLACLIGLDNNSHMQTQLDGEWFEVPRLSENPSWRYFRSEHYAPGASFKLYVNPRLDFLREAIVAAAPVLLATGFSGFKLGRSLKDLLRPDKFVAYAKTQEQVDTAGRAILAKLEGMPVQAVPFTAAVDDSGLVSWGVDPPRIERLTRCQGTSWRRWVTDRLAVALLAGRAGGADSPFEFALQRATLEGIDVNSWTPAFVPWAEMDLT